MPQNLPLAMLLMLAATVLFAIAATLQHSAVGEQTDDLAPDDSLGARQFWALIRSPRWWLGMGSNALGAVLQVLALLLAPITVVQPLAILAVPWTVMMASRVQRHRITGAMWGAVTLSLAGTAWFAVVAVAHAADHETMDTSGIIVGCLLGFGIGGLLALLGARGRPQWRSFAWASAGAVIFGLESGIVKAIGEYVATRDWLTSGTFWFLVIALVAGALLATAFVQQAYATGPAEVVVGILNAVGPVAGVAFGIAVLGEGAEITGAAGLMMAASAALAIVGVVLLSRFHPTAVASAADAPAPL